MQWDPQHPLGRDDEPWLARRKDCHRLREIGKSAPKSTSGMYKHVPSRHTRRDWPKVGSGRLKSYLVSAPEIDALDGLLQLRTVTSGGKRKAHRAQGVMLSKAVHSHLPCQRLGSLATIRGLRIS